MTRYNALKYCLSMLLMLLAFQVQGQSQGKKKQQPVAPSYAQRAARTAL